MGKASIFAINWSEAESNYGDAAHSPTRVGDEQLKTELTRTGDSSIFPYVWNYETVRCYQFTCGVGAIDATRHLSFACPPCAQWPACGKDSSPLRVTRSDAFVPPKCFGGDGSGAAKKERAFHFVLGGFRECESSYKFSDGKLLWWTRRLWPDRQENADSQVTTRACSL